MSIEHETPLPVEHMDVLSHDVGDQTIRTLGDLLVTAESEGLPEPSGYNTSGDWRHRSLCRDGVDPDFFFPVGDGVKAQEQIKEVKEFCEPCPVRLECLQWAIETGQDDGVWGGLSKDERRAHKQRNARTSARTV